MKAMTNKERKLCRRAYTKNYAWLKTMAKRLHGKWGGHYEDVLADCSYHFPGAFMSYDPAKGMFTNWMYRYIWQHVCDAQRSEITRFKKRQSELKDETHTINRDRFRELYSSLEPDSRLVLARIVHYGKERDAVAVVTGILSERKKWPQSRIEKAFNELKEAYEDH